MRVTLSTDAGQELATLTVCDLYISEMGEMATLDIKARTNGGIPPSLICQLIDTADGDLMTSYVYRARS